MDRWIPLFEIFLKSTTPETEASIWLNLSFDASSSLAPITPSSFLSLLTGPITTISNSSSPPTTKRVMFIQTLPDMVQSRILSFLALENDRFCKRELTRLARSVLTDSLRIDFWVKSAARNLLDHLSDSNYEWISGLSLDSGEGIVDDEEFESLPSWLKDTSSSDHELVFPWLPLSLDEFNSKDLFVHHESEQDSLSLGEGAGDNLEEVAEDMEIDCPSNASLAKEIQDMAVGLRTQVVNFESCSKTVELANVISSLCLDNGGDSFSILGLIEPWRVDDEIASILMPHLLNGTDHRELDWPSQVLSSIILPKMLILEEPASRVLVAATIDYCKLHQRAAEYALLFPLVMRIGGINNPLCDVITRIIKECLHPVHVSSFCQKLLCGGEGEKRLICLPCHQFLISNELVWTESLFNLFHNILNLNIQLTQDSVDQLALQVQELAQRFSKSLRFGNFLLCFITKCSLLLTSHKLLLTKAIEQTDTIVTKSILSKFSSF